MSGETSIAQITTAGELMINPKVAMLVERTTIRKKSKLGEEAFESCSKTSPRRSGLKNCILFRNTGLYLGFPLLWFAYLQIIINCHHMRHFSANFKAITTPAALTHLSENYILTRAADR
jgi:hypothetical protein